MLGRGKAHSGTCAVAVASLVCGLHAASLPLAAQPLSMPADHSAPVAGFDERFSPQLRAQPVFMRPEIQELIASLPPSTDTAEALAFDAEAESQPVENTASVEVREPEPEAAASLPNAEMPLPEFPPPPQPADVVLPSAEELALAARPSSPANTSSVAPPEQDRRVQPAKPAASQSRAEKKPVPNRRAGQRPTPAKKPVTGRNNPAVTGSVPTCTAGTTCVSQQQTFAIFFGFVVGALLGGPVGAIAGGTAGAIMASEPPKTSPAPAPRR